MRKIHLPAALIALAVLTLAAILLLNGTGTLSQLQFPGLPPAPSEPPSHAQSQPPSQSPPPAGCGPLKIYILNVSQADAILVITPQNKTVLIDSGSGMKPNSSSNLAAFLQRNGITRIDDFILSHYHEDHIGGVEDVFGQAEVGTIYDNGNCGNYSSGVQKKLQAYEKLVHYVAVEGDMDIAVDSCLSQSTLVVAYDRPQGCWPSGKETSNENENSVMPRLVYGNTSFFFAADCESNCEAELVRQGTQLRSDFLKVGHHGSRSSTAYAHAAAPESAVISPLVDPILEPKNRGSRCLACRLVSDRRLHQWLLVVLDTPTTEQNIHIVLSSLSFANRRDGSPIDALHPRGGTLSRAVTVG